jgi:hypothetical protein
MVIRSPEAQGSRMTVPGPLEPMDGRPRGDGLPFASPSLGLKICRVCDGVVGLDLLGWP